MELMSVAYGFVRGSALDLARRRPDPRYGPISSRPPHVLWATVPGPPVHQPTEWLVRRAALHQESTVGRSTIHDDDREKHCMTAIIEAQGLTKRFGKVRALDGLDLVAQSGQVTALLGPNGAGKTTFVSAVATLLRPDGGEIHVAGVDVCAEPKRVRKVIGLAGQALRVEAWGRVW